MNTNTTPAVVGSSAELGRVPPMRAVRLTLKLDADDMRELTYALRTLADHAERGELTCGVSGGPCSGYIYELLQDPSMTHNAYHAAVRAYLDALKQPPAEVCGNCDSALPDGCGGLFKSDGKHCRLNTEALRQAPHEHR